MPGNQPPFIIGLHSAKRILLDLKERKLKQQQNNSLQSPLRESISKAEKPSSHNKDTNKSVEAPVQPAVPVHKVKTEGLRQRINQIGSQLFHCYCQNQSYEIILNHLANHYAQNRHIVQENDKLKRKAYELHEHIQDYKQKIKNNYEHIQQHQKQLQEVKVLTAEQLREYLMAEAQKAEEQPHQRLPSSAHSISSLQHYSQPEPEPQRERKLTLRFESLSKEVARKPGRKAPVQEQEIRRSFYHSELYTL